MAILYVETNLIIGLARGQDAAVEELVANPPREVRLVLPSVCLMEALTAFENVERRVREWVKGIDEFQREVGRDFARDGDLDRLLPQFNAQVSAYHLELRRRFGEWLRLLPKRAELIHPSGSVVADGFEDTPVRDLSDALILRCVLEHAAANPAPHKAFLTDNAKDFDQPKTRKRLADAGVRLFKRTRDFQGWFGSLGR